MTTATDLSKLKAVCASCSLKEVCVPRGISAEDLNELDAIVSTRRRVPRGTSLFHGGQTFRALYAVRLGFFKTHIAAEDGREQITGFQMPGELLGLDGVANDEHCVNAVAIEDSEVCVLPYADLERIARHFPPLQHQLHRVMSREIVRENRVLMLLGSMTADERVAAFLLNLSERFRQLGYSPTDFVLRMTRQEIGSYLGLKIETVSRAFSRLQKSGQITVSNRAITLSDLEGLRSRLSAEH